MFGADPNWGRVLATVGARAGSQHYPVDPRSARVTIQGVPVYAGEPVLTDPPALRAKMRAPEVKVDVMLTAGTAEATAWGCDLGYDYVKLNADYTSLIVQTADGGLAKDDRLTNYSPSFKRKLIVEALSYISRFSGTRCVIKLGGGAIAKPALEQAFCDDIKLLRSVGLQPIVIHGGTAEITRTLQQMGHPPAEFVDGVRVTSPSDLKIVDMVLGSINSHLVTLLNLDGAHALGISGKDGALLRAKKKVSPGGRDLGLVGDITQVNGGVIEMLLGQGYVPVISPIALGDDGQSYNVSADEVAAKLAQTLKAQKLIYLTELPGILEHGELVTDLTIADLERKVPEADGSWRVKLTSMIEALRGGVGRVHVIDGRTPHNLIAELFTDRGVGTLVTRMTTQTARAARRDSRADREPSGRDPGGASLAARRPRPRRHAGDAVTRPRAARSAARRTARRRHALRASGLATGDRRFSMISSARSTTTARWSSSTPRRARRRWLPVCSIARAFPRCSARSQETTRSSSHRHAACRRPA